MKTYLGEYVAFSSFCRVVYGTCLNHHTAEQFECLCIWPGECDGCIIDAEETWISC